MATLLIVHDDKNWPPVDTFTEHAIIRASTLKEGIEKFADRSSFDICIVCVHMTGVSALGGFIDTVRESGKPFIAVASPEKFEHWRLAFRSYDDVEVICQVNYGHIRRLIEAIPLPEPAPPTNMLDRPRKSVLENKR